MLSREWSDRTTCSTSPAARVPTRPRSVITRSRTNTYGTVSGGLIYVYGGVTISGSTFTAVDNLLRYNPATNVWTNLGSAGTVGARGNYGAVSPLGTGQLLITDGANASGVSTTA